MSDNYTVSDLLDFDGDHQRVGVGHTFDGGFDDGEIAVEPGDVVVFDDPDAGCHAGECELIRSEVIVALVDKLYAVDYDWESGYAVEVGTTGPLGRIGVDDAYTGIVTENGVLGGLNDDMARSHASELVDSDEWDSHYRRVHHLGEHGVPEGLWAQYDESDRSGRGCPVCRGDEGQDGTVVDGE